MEQISLVLPVNCRIPQTSETQGVISQFCSTQGISWKFIPERAPNFGGLWESAVKSMKTHLRHVISDVKLTFEEFTTILAQVEAVLNSRPLVSMPCDDDGIEPLTPGHFLIGKPLESLPDFPIYLSPTMLASMSVIGPTLLETMVHRIPLYSETLHQMASSY